jgi:AcrR family transcriptional regulator
MTTTAPPKRRRPYNSPTRQAQADATKRAVLGAARDVFARSGYAAATIEGVAAAAQVSVPTVYALFGSKPALLAALVADSGSAPDIRDLARKALAEEEPRRRITAAAKVVRTIMQREGALLQLLRQAGTGRSELEDARRQVHRQQRGALGAALRPLYASGSLRAGLDFQEVVATFCALASPESYFLLTDEFGWSAARWERWLAGCGIRLFLDGGP